MNMSFKRKNTASNVRKPSSESILSLTKREKRRYLTASDFDRIDTESSTCSSAETSTKTNENNQDVIQYQPVNFAKGIFIRRAQHNPISSFPGSKRKSFIKDPKTTM